MTLFEKNAIISGIGISRIGRRTGIPGLELTLEAAREAIADAGLSPSDIDGVATLGDVTLTEALPALGRGGARHVLVYRTVQMLGGGDPIAGCIVLARR